MNKAESVTLSQRWFPSKVYIPLVSVTKKCKLTYHERLIYSFLVFRLRKDQGATKRKIALRLGIDRGETVPKALTKLATPGEGRSPLVELRDGRYWALQPSGEEVGWFAYNGRTTEAWHRQFSTFRMYIPSEESPLTAKVNGLLWLLYSLARRSGRPYVFDQNQKGLAVLMKASQKFVASALESLQAFGLVTINTLGFALSEPNADHLRWWRDRPVRKDQEKKQFILSKVLGWRGKPGPDDSPKMRQAKEDVAMAGKWADKFAVQMLAANYTEESIVAYWKDMAATLRTTEKVLTFTFAFEELFREAETVHGQNGYAPSSVGILRTLSSKAIQKVLLSDG